MNIENMSPELRNKLITNILAGFLAQFGIVPSADGIQVREYPPHIVWTLQARIPDALVDRYDADDYFEALVKYLIIHNRMLTAVKLGAYNAEIYTCPCGCGDFLYVSVNI